MADRGHSQKRKERQEKEAKDGKGVKNEGDHAQENREVPSDNNAALNGDSEDLQVEPMELPPFEITARERIDHFAFKFQFKNVEYSSGRNKTFLCYLVDKGNTTEGLDRGCLEDEHTGPHAEDAFFTQCLSDYVPSLKYTITWYVSCSPCSACAAKIADELKAKKNIQLNIFAARLLEWEEAEIQAGLKALQKVGCKLRVMKPLDFSYVWDTFVENEDQPLNLWEDCKDNYEYYHEKLADVLQ
ncbi:C-_U-editing enzyme APOBEC-2-like [Entelurus aequoreus]|uniref:C->U-editing enzyme APOBEC-2-like n=1 Tax=Entelurus aequoreus TaxID=161455 RepID=UPI002B1DD6D7|nr:C->U-editing enzyme APOBEC-2-like [Entelurus aequoreus]XP_061924360.1 C->U-editing enzyme APOBEC-2-like [Entelurus aequoreus]